MADSAIKSFIPYAWRLVKRRPWYYATGIVSVILLDAVDMLPAVIVRQITNELQANPSQIKLLPYALGLLACYVLLSLLRMVWRFTLMLPSRSIEREVRQEAYDRLLQADYSQASRLKIGDVISALSQDISNIRTFMGPGVLVLFDAGAYLIFIPTTLFVLIGPGAWWVLLPFAVLAIAVWVVHRPLEQGHEKVSAILGDLSQYVYEEGQGAKFFRSEGLIELRRRKYDVLIQTLFHRQIGNTRWELGLDSCLQMVIQVSYLMVLGLAYAGKSSAAFNLGTLTLSLQLLDKLIWPLMAMTYLMNLLQSASAGARRLRLVDNLPVKTMGNHSLSSAISKIDINQLSVRTADGVPVLADFAIHLKAGERVALIGAVGSGKTVALEVLAGLWEPKYLTYEQYSVNEINFQDLDRASLLPQISYVPQTPQIFGKSLAQNLSPHLPLIDSKLHEALEAADMTQDVALFPDGLKTSIGEKGLNLSGGQKQRTLIARSFHSGAQLFLWDDAISALDTKTERKVIENLKRLSPEAILVLTTHRLSALGAFDRVIVLDHGRIVKVGTLEEIKRDHALFATLTKIEAEALSNTSS